MPKILITTVPFAEVDETPIHLLSNAGIDFVINPIGRKLQEGELSEMIGEYDAMIAGTEAITERVMSNASRLKIIARVGIGLDNVDLYAARRRGISVTYTPDAPAPAVADLTIGLMISLLRQTHVSNAHLHTGKWKRHFGRRLGEVTVGIIGMGRIGTGVLARLQGFGCRRVLAADKSPNRALETAFRFEWTSRESLLRESDIVTLHVPLTRETRNMIARAELDQMKPDAFLINTARGGIVNEADLHAALSAGHLAGAAMDVFEQEPYTGPLADIERCHLTAHMGSMSVDCRSRMEREATEEIVRFFGNRSLANEVPEEEYEIHR